MSRPDEGEEIGISLSNRTSYNEIHARNDAEPPRPPSQNGFIHSIKNSDNLKDFTSSIKKGKENTIKFAIEFKDLVLPSKDIFSSDNIVKSVSYLPRNARARFHVPFFPLFHRPGWLLNIILGPYNDVWLENLLTDVWAGITVGLTLIPQALSYGLLANLQPVQGLYAAILPSALYIIFGTGMTLAVGPVAVVSLLTGQIVTNYVPNYNQPAFFDDASAVAAEVALCVGILLTVCSILNFGSFIQYFSKSVLSGFTSGAACVIGLNQLRNAFGFSYPQVPQQGQPGFDYNYEVMRWYRIHWNDRYSYTAAQLRQPSSTASARTWLSYNRRVLSNNELYRNTYATQICFSIYAAIIVIQLLKWGFKATPARKQKVSFRIWLLFASLAPFICVIISAFIAREIKHNDYDYTDPYFLHDHEYNAYYLRVVGIVPSGLGFLKIPDLKYPFFQLLGESIPIAIIAYMESYAVARNIAADRGELHILHPSQELFANGVANLIASVSSAYPVCGSFSRSALNHASGAKTPLSKATTMIVVIISLQFLTGTFQYIPQAALAAIIFGALWNLISFTDLWEAWKFNKKDFITMLATWIVTLTFNTELGLASGIGVSCFWLLYDIAYKKENNPILLHKAEDNDNIDVVQLHQDISFLTCNKVKDFVNALTFTEPVQVSPSAPLRERIYFFVTQTLDDFLIYREQPYVKQLPKAIIVDFTYVHVIDLSGLTAMHEMFLEVRRLGVFIAIIKALPNVEKQLIEFGIENNSSTDDVNIDEYLSKAGMIPLKKNAPVITEAEVAEMIASSATYKKVTDLDRNDEVVTIDEEMVINHV